MGEPALFVALVAAVAIGFGLGRWQRGRRAAVGTHPYLASIGHLVNEQHDLALESFIQTVRISDETVDVYLALASLIRRRGELDKATRVHRMLLAQPSLSTRNRDRIELELARDYLHAGLLGRAETLLQTVADRSDALRGEARRDLLDVYERERDWERASHTARMMVEAGQADIAPRFAHYACELALAALELGDLRNARECCARAVGADAHCARAWLLRGRIEMAAGNLREAIRALRRVADADDRFVGEALPMLEACAQRAGTLDRYTRFLEETARRRPTSRVARARARLLEQTGDAAAARELLEADARQRRDLSSLHAWMRAASEAGANVDVPALADWCDVLGTHIASAPAYRCGACGFSASILQWQCPSCRGWGSMLPSDGPGGAGGSRSHG